jgi:hypothetical protein
MPRFRSYIRRLKLATLTATTPAAPGGSWAAQTLSYTMKRVNGRRLASVQVELVVTNGTTAPTYQGTNTVANIVGEIRLKASDYAGGAQRSVRRLSGVDLIYWNREMDQGIDRDLQALTIQTGAVSTTYNPTLHLHLSHPLLDESVRHRSALPLNAPGQSTGEGVAFVVEEPVLEIDITPSATIYGANWVPQVDVIVTLHEVEMPQNEPYVADELASGDFTWSGSGRPTAYEFSQNGWLLSSLMVWRVSGTLSDAILATTSDYFAFKLGKVEQEGWTIPSLRSFNEAGRYAAPAALASATTLPNLNNPDGVVMRDWLFNTPTASGWEPNSVPSLYSANAGDRVMIEPTNLVASCVTRFVNHRAFISDITLLTRV